jgi:hypothetical protein
LFIAGLAVQAIGIATSFLEAAVGGGYYDATYTYRMKFAPVWTQARLLWFYATSNAPAPIGRGFDRWWLLLSKAGVSHGTLWAIGLTEVAGAAISGCVLWRSWKKRESAAEILVTAQPVTAD